MDKGKIKRIVDLRDQIRTIESQRDKVEKMVYDNGRYPLSVSLYNTNRDSVSVGSWAIPGGLLQLAKVYLASLKEDIEQMESELESLVK